MKTRLPIIAGAVACLALVLAGCSEVPFLELKETQAVRDEARDIAKIYAPEEYDAAIAIYDQARLEIEAQSGKSGFSRSYGHAAELLAQAKEGFEKAMQTAMAKREQVKSEAEEKAQLAATAIQEAEEALQGVRRTNRNRSDRERWRQGIEEMTYSLEDANEYLSSEYYKEAIGYFDTILADCEIIQSEIAGT